MNGDTMNEPLLNPIKPADMTGDGNAVRVIHESAFRARRFIDETPRTWIKMEELPSVLRGGFGPGEFILEGV